MAKGSHGYYNPYDYGKKEVDLHRLFYLQMEDAKRYFLNITKPRLDRSYKLYIGYTGDRQREIKRWQANIFVMYVQSVVETLMPRILDARPEFGVFGRSEEDHAKAEKQEQLADYFWEISGMDTTSEDMVRASLIYGTSFLQVSWKKDVRKMKFLKTKDVTDSKPKWATEERVFYDAPYCEWVDNYSLWYDWHNTDRKNKQYWFKRLVLTGEEIARRYPGADKTRLALALRSPGGDITDYTAVRQQCRTTHDLIIKSAGKSGVGSTGYGSDKYYSTQEGSMKMYEVFEWWRPFDDAYSVMVGGQYVPILKGGSMPIPFDFKEAPFIETAYLKIPGEFEGYGIPLILENPQIMLNLIKNQRLDAATLNIHKMWIVNPLANINKSELVTRPFGIIYSIDPQGVREVEFSDIKSSAYKEEDMLKSDMRYSSGVDDFSMGVGGGASSATEVRHLRESTLERVRLYINHLGGTFSEVLRYWMDMQRQFFTKEMTIRIIGEDGEELFPLIQKKDLMGSFDYRAKVLPSIAGQNEIKKKQGMDLFQLLINMPFVDPRRLTAKMLADWSWSLDSIAKSAEEEQAPGMEGMMGEEGTGVPGAEGGPPPEELAAMQGAQQGSQLSPDSMQGIRALLRSPQELAAAAQNPMQQMANPVNLLRASGPPPTARGVPGGRTTNPRGLNRGGKVDTNVPTRQTTSAEDRLTNRAFNIQR